MPPKQINVDDENWYLNDPKYREAIAKANLLGPDHEVVQVPGTDEWAIVPPVEIPPKNIMLNVLGVRYILIFDRIETYEGKKCEVYQDPFDNVEAYIPMEN